jgi:hypothetical protein
MVLVSISHFRSAAEIIAGAESDCIFTTGEENPESIWVITDFDPLRHRIEKEMGT